MQNLKLKYLTQNLFERDIWLISFLMLTFFEFINKYVFADWEYIKFLLIIMGIDLITGARKAYKSGELVVTKGLRRTIDKATQYFSFLIVCHVLTYVTFNKQPHHYLDWLPRVSCLYLILIEAKSIFENIYHIDRKVNMDFFIGVINNLLKMISNNNHSKE